MRKKTEPTTTLTPEVAQRALQFDLANLLTKVRRGQPLTRAERELLESRALRSNAPADSPQFVSTQEELARQCGVSPQLIAYRIRQPGHPQRSAAGHDVAAWKTHLARVCRPGTLPSEARKPRRDSRAEVFGDGLLAGFEQTAKAMLDMMSESLPTVGLRPTPAQRDRIAVALWLAGAAAVHVLAVKAGCADSPLLPDSDGKTFPPEIAGAAARVGIDLWAELRLAGFKPATVS
jgi:hypothetical protein